MKLRNAKKRRPTCARCGKLIEESRRGKQAYCLACHAENMRRIRPKHSNLPEIARKKANTRSYANVYKRRGKLIKKPCERCGKVTSQMHHPDYTKPLEVKWLCRGCHLELHKNE